MFVTLCAILFVVGKYIIVINIIIVIGIYIIIIINVIVVIAVIITWYYLQDGIYWIGYRAIRHVHMEHGKMVTNKHLMKPTKCNVGKVIA